MPFHHRKRKRQFSNLNTTYKVDPSLNSSSSKVLIFTQYTQKIHYKMKLYFLISWFVNHNNNNKVKRNQHICDTKFELLFTECSITLCKICSSMSCKSRTYEIGLVIYKSEWGTIYVAFSSCDVWQLFSPLGIRIPSSYFESWQNDNHALLSFQLN